MTKPPESDASHPHPNYGPCDAIANGLCAECMRIGEIPNVAPAPSRLEQLEGIVRLLSKSRLCEWICHTVPEWTPEVETSLEEMDDLIRRSRELQP
jgi:hypothetical protein